MKQAELHKRFCAYIDREKLLADVKVLVVGLSGGADSICLFNLLSDISENYDIRLVPVHVHHGIRGEEADRDAAFCREAAAARGLDCEVRHVDVPAYAKEQGLTTEEAARILRYRELETVCEERGADAIALAHHQGDQAETVLMNLLRGAGPVGLAGMEPRREKKIRPLLFASKNEILEYLEENHITYVEDSTNSDLEYTRNRIRSELLPLAESIYPRAQEHIAALAEDMSKWTRQLREDLPAPATAQAGVAQAPAGPAPAAASAAAATSDTAGTAQAASVSIDRDRYLALPEAGRQLWLRDTMQPVIPGLKDVSRKHYQQLDDLLQQKKPGRRLDLPGRCYAVSTYTGLDIIAETGETDAATHGTGSPAGTAAPHSPSAAACSTPASPDFSRFSMELVDRDTFYKKKTDFFSEKDYTKYIDYDRIESGLLLRHPREGDYLVIDSEGNRKKLARYYIDQKIPRDERALREVLADGSHIVWALPDRISEHYKVTDTTTRILKITRDAI